MKYKYEISFADDGRPSINMSSNLVVVEQFLETEIISSYSGETVLCKLNEVILEQEKQSVWWGNLYALDVKKEQTRVFNHFLDDDSENGIRVDDEYESFIESVELREILLVWVEEIRKYRESGS